MTENFLPCLVNDLKPQPIFIQPLKPYFFCMTICAMRTGIAIGRRCGVVFADSRESAESTAWERFGGNSACKLWVDEVPEEGYDYNVYKSEII